MAPSPGRAPRPACAGKRTATAIEEAIVREYRAGLTMKQIAAQHRLHRATISEILRRLDVPSRSQSMSLAQIDEAVRLYASGLSLAHVGEQLGFSAHTVQSRLRERGVCFRDTHGRQRPIQ